MIFFKFAHFRFILHIYKYIIILTIVEKYKFILLCKTQAIKYNLWAYFAPLKSFLPRPLDNNHSIHNNYIPRDNINLGN